MHSLIIRSIALLFICSIFCPVHAMDVDEENSSDHSSLLQLVVLENVEGDLPLHPPALRQLVLRFQKLCDASHPESSFQVVNHAYQAFDSSIFYPVHFDNDDDDPSAFLKKARAIRDEINTYITNQKETGDSNFLVDLLQDTMLPLLGNRIDLARLDNNVFNDGGHKGIMPFTPPFTLNRNKVLAFVTGRIFQIKDHPHEHVLMGTASGTLVRYNEQDNRIESLEVGKKGNLTHILTCAHALKAAEDRSKFYFVQTKILI